MILPPLSQIPACFTFKMQGSGSVNDYAWTVTGNQIVNTRDTQLVSSAASDLGGSILYSAHKSSICRHPQLHSKTLYIGMRSCLPWSWNRSVWGSHYSCSQIVGRVCGHGRKKGRSRENAALGQFLCHHW